MSIKPSVAVIVPVHNTEEKLLIACVDSILAQTYSNIEIIIVNNGTCKIGTIRALNDYENRKKITVINTVASGVSYARNTGLEYTHADYVVFVDSDDYISKKYVELMVEAALKTNSKVVYPRTIQEGINARKEIIRFKEAVLNDEKQEYCILSHDYKYTCRGALILKAVINSRFREDMKYAEDTYIMIDLIKNNKTAFQEKSVYYYRDNNEGAMSKIGKNAIKYFKDSTLMLDHIANSDKTIQKAANYVKLIKANKLLSESTNNKEIYEKLKPYLPKNNISSKKLSVPIKTRMKILLLRKRNPLYYFILLKLLGEMR